MINKFNTNKLNSTINGHNFKKNKIRRITIN